ncbi:hypothetical protein FG05_12602 [Fusarium graminearum]|nr:hypothetical protein FG05_12602 [Fusarium graminearum]
MVNTGQPSRGCTVCKKRKLKRVRWSDTYMHELEPETWKRPLSPPARDRATTFFMRQHVFGISGGSGSLLLGGGHEYLPILLREESAFGLLSTVVAAAGFAALSNAGNVAEWRSESFRLYQIAIVQLQRALQDPVQRVSDETLGAVLLMGTFDVQNFAPWIKPYSSSMDTFSQHIIAAARCIEMRGPEQFRTPASVKLFMQMRRNMITTCHQLQEPFPFEVSKWSRWAEPHQPEAYIPVNKLSQINEGLASTRAKLKYLGVTDPEIISQSLMPFDRMMEQWADDLPPIWEYKSYRSIGPDGIPSSRYDLQYDIYNDPWIACIWNSYRNARLLIHESIIVATLKHGSQEQKETLQSSFKILRSMADGICYSAAYHLGHRRQDDTVMIHPETGRLDNTPAPGGFLLLWPLFFAAIQRTSSTDQRLITDSEKLRLGHGLIYGRDTTIDHLCLHAMVDPTVLNRRSIPDARTQQSLGYYSATFASMCQTYTANNTPGYIYV